MEDRVWYASYGSNLSAARLSAYLVGGTPPGGTIAHPGCRDPSPPRRSSEVWLPGQVSFARHSRQWGGGVAFLDPDAPGASPGRAYDLGVDQLADVLAQEGGRQPPGDLDVAAVVAAGRWTADPGWYGTVVHTGSMDGLPVLTFTAPWRAGDVEATPPSAAYLRLLVDGLGEAHGWSVERAVDHLLTCAGVALRWDATTLREALTGP